MSPALEPALKPPASPTTFVIDRRGNVVKRYLGEPDFAALHTLLESELAERI